MARPLSTAPRAIGNERKRSMRPLLMSSQMPTAVVAEAKITVWAKMPGMRNSLYDPPSGNGIAPPKTNANSSTNMIDCITAKIASSGIRGTRLRLRPAMIRPSRTSCLMPPVGFGRVSVSLVMLPPCLSWRRGCRYFSCVPGKRQEDVVERGPPQTEVVDGESRVVKHAADLHQLLHAAVAGQRDAALVFVHDVVAV